MFSYIRQIFQCDRGTTVLHRFSDNGLADFVIYVFNVPRFSAGDLGQKLLGALGAVALKTAAKCKEFVAFVAKLTAAEERTRTCGGKIVLSNINTQDTIAPIGSGIWKVKNKVKVPTVAFMDKLGFLDFPLCKILRLEIADTHFNLDATGECEQRKQIALHAKRSGIVMHRTVFEGKQAPFLTSLLGIVCKERFVGICNRFHSITHHLAAQCGMHPTHSIVGEVMQRNTIGAFIDGCKRNYLIARRVKFLLQVFKCGVLFRCCEELN